MNSKPYSVITSRKAKDHLDMARQAMLEFQQGMIAQRSRIEQRQTESQNLAIEDRRTAIANAHDRNMQMDKLTATVNI